MAETNQAHHSKHTPARWETTSTLSAPRSTRTTPILLKKIKEIQTPKMRRSPRKAARSSAKAQSRQIPTKLYPEETETLSYNKCLRTVIKRSRRHRRTPTIGFSPRLRIVQIRFCNRLVNRLNSLPTVQWAFMTKTQSQ